jgi:hypothetical protein
MIRELATIHVRCAACGTEFQMNSDGLGDRMGEPPTMANIGRIHHQLQCTHCGGARLHVSDNEGRALLDPDHLRQCIVCDGVIPLPRLEAMPQTNQCAACATNPKIRPPAKPMSLPHNESLCPLCGAQIIRRIRRSDKRPFIACSNRRCRWTRSIPKASP